MKKILFGFLVAIALGACSSDEGGTDGSVILTDGTQTTQIVYADETQKGEGIKFTATEPWAATVNEATVTRADAGKVNWLTLSAYSGGAGDFTLNLTLTPNTTGKSRKAEIRITAGKTVITIVVEQKAETESGGEVLSKVVKKISRTYTYNSEKAWESDSYIDNCTRTLSYNDQGQVARMVIEEVGNDHKENSTMTFDYTITGEIKIKENWAYNGGPTYNEDYIVKLNEQGNAERIQAADKDPGVFEDYMRFSYTDDNRLAQWKDADAGSETSSATFSYSDGLWSKYEYISGKHPDENSTVNFDMNKAYTKRYPNNCPVNIIAFFEDDDDYDFLYYIGRLGKTSDCLPELVPDFIRDDDDRNAGHNIYTNPGVTVDEHYFSIKWLENDLVMDYTFDNDNSLTGIKTERAFSIMKTTYTVVVGYEPVVPDHPEVEGYKYEITNKQTTKVKDDKDILSWSIEY